ncbi:hypothetical protein EIN_370370 [Entamoeba invadens IP1]|uniref:F-box domain-containing protein n=1 Tax=Entamoeba invadens IP1 TaxID=370355 RepID=A0A0A1UBV9_ENTIV|nr:hypothetical protein EIN_370370 [Entamoeba invadens IP1]ELP92685.1 hypothetical protein EIN_370370 [Entamoeba invadens IP1]|eukprot:XP_004259456.1 hypothetical protein EIN_370370 [Entamoeba invadens IP1]
MKVDEVIEDMLKNKHTWVRIPSVISPPVNCLETYESVNESTVTIRSTGLFASNLEKVGRVIDNIKLVQLLFPDVLIDRVEGNRVYISAKTSIEEKRIKLSYIKECQKSDDSILFINAEYDPSYCIYYAFLCTNKKNGVEVITQIQLDKTKITNRTYQFYINHQRKFIYNFGEVLNYNKEGLVMLEMERDFLTRVDQTSLFPYVIHSNKCFTMLCNEKASEVVIIGKSKFRIDVLKLIESLYNHIAKSPIFFVCKTIRETEKLLFQHVETTLFGQGVSTSDIVYTSRIVEGTIFTACRTTKQMCTEKHNDDHFEVVLCAESINIGIDGSPYSDFYYHFRCPQFQFLPLPIRKRKLTILMDAILLERVGIENFSSFQLCGIDDNEFTLSKKILLSSLIMQAQMIKHKFKVIVPLEKCPPQGVGLDITKLDRRLLFLFLTQLPLADLVAFMATCKRFYLIVKNEDEIWHGIYDKYLNPYTFYKANLNSTIRLSPRSNYNFFEIVNEQMIIRHKWQNKAPLIKQRIKVYEHLPVDFLFPRLVDSTFFVGTSEGRIKRLRYSDYQSYYEFFFKEKIRAVETNHEVEKMLIGFADGEVKVYYNKFDEVHNVTKTCEYDGMKFTDYCNTMIAWKSGVVDLYDLRLKSLVNQYKHHDGKILHADKVAENLVVSSGVDGCLIGYDLRCDGVAFKAPLTNKTIQVFDGFDENIVCGAKGMILLYDMRTNKFAASRRLTFSYVNCLKCYNRRFVVGTTDRLVLSYECTTNWIGKQTVIYQHESPVSCVSFDDSMLMTGSTDGVVYYSNFSASYGSLF